MPSKHFAAFVVMREHNHKLQFLVLRAHNTDPQFSMEPKIKFPGGTNEEHRDEIDPFVTAVREFREEVGQQAKVGLEPVFIWPYSQKSTNLQFFYFALESDFEGEMRKGWINDGEDNLSPPYWMDEADLPLVYKTHRQAGQSAIRYYHRKRSEEEPPQSSKILVG